MDSVQTRVAFGYYYIVLSNKAGAVLFSVVCICNCVCYQGFGKTVIFVAKKLSQVHRQLFLDCIVKI